MLKRPSKINKYHKEFILSLKEKHNKEHIIDIIKTTKKINTQIRDEKFKDEFYKTIIHFQDISFLKWISEKGLYRIKKLYFFSKEHLIPLKELVEELYKSFKEHKERDPTIIKDSDSLDGVSLTTKKHIYYRNFTNLKALDIWQTLLKKGLPVEKIIKIYDSIPKELEKYFLKNSLGNKYVISESSGETIEHILESRSLSQTTILNIINQSIDIINKMWKLGYTHQHPHFNNWTVKYENHKYKTYLIDFNDAKKINHLDFEEKKDRIIKDYNEMLNSLIILSYRYLTKTIFNKLKAKLDNALKDTLNYFEKKQ